MVVDYGSFENWCYPLYFAVMFQSSHSCGNSTLFGLLDGCHEPQLLSPELFSLPVGDVFEKINIRPFSLVSKFEGLGLLRVS